MGHGDEAQRPEALLSLLVENKDEAKSLTQCIGPTAVMPLNGNSSIALLGASLVFQPSLAYSPSLKQPINQLKSQ